jgi:hypothetical protein
VRRRKTRPQEKDTPHEDAPSTTETFPKSLTVLIPEFRHQNCRDKRDRVFGLLALAVGTPHIEVTYDASPINLDYHVLEQHMYGRAVGK